MINRNFLKLNESYLFSTIAKKVREYKGIHPDARVISLGIGDVTQPLPKACIEAMHRAVDEMGDAATFRGYGPEQGYEFLRQAILDNDFRPRGVDLSLDEIFISDGAKSDCGNIGDILSQECSVGMTDPVYPVYVDSNVMGGRGDRITFLPVTEGNGFIPAVPDKHIDIIYLCFPNNPTGLVISRNELQRWVDYAVREKSLIIYDAAYEAYIRHDDIPHSVFEIPGSKQCAIELRSFSKTAGFTGVRCGCTIVPKSLSCGDGSGVLNRMWLRRQCTKFNGTSYITQRAAEAIYSPEGKEQVRETIDYYMENARLMRCALTTMGYNVRGGEDAPYLWLQTPGDMDSWQFFEYLLREQQLITTPGVGFGPSGEGYVRLTAFGCREDCQEAMQRMSLLSV